jgi:hypothetical protein
MDARFMPVLTDVIDVLVFVIGSSVVIKIIYF